MARIFVFGLLAAAVLLCLLAGAQADGSYDYKKPAYKADEEKFKPAYKADEEKKYKPKEEDKYKPKEYKVGEEKKDYKPKEEEKKYKAEEKKDYKPKEEEKKYKAEEKKDYKPKEEEKKYKAEEEKPAYKPDYKPVEKPSYKKVDEDKKYKKVDSEEKKPVYPAYKRVAVEGYVNCQDGYSKKPLEGAIVSLSCAKSEAPLQEKVNAYGYFYFPLGYGAYKGVDVDSVKVSLVSSPSKNCYIATNVNNGKSGAKIDKSKGKIVGETLVYPVGPFAFAPAMPAYKSPYHA